jgi:hypothetical protein
MSPRPISEGVKMRTLKGVSHRGSPTDPASPVQSESDLRQEYQRTSRWSLDEASQELIATFMCSQACTVSLDETNGKS